MTPEQRAALVGALTEAYVLMPDKNSLALYQEAIDPLLQGVSEEGRRELAQQLRGGSALGDKVHSLAGLAFYLDPPVGGA